MAEKDLKVVIGAEDRYSAEFSRFQGKLGGINTSTIRTAAILGTLGLSIGGVIGFFQKAIEAANEQEAAEKKLSVALGYTSQALLDQASALQQTTTFGDEQIINAQALISSFTKNENKTRALTQATLDLASAKDMDLASAAELVAKTLGSETNALSRQGIQVHGMANSTERLTSLTEGIARLYSGQAAAAADTFGGKMIQLKNAVGELSEAVGGHITKSSLFRNILEAEIEGLYALASIVQNIGKFTDETKMQAKVAALQRLTAEVAAIEDQRRRAPQKGLLSLFEMSDSELNEKRRFIVELRAEIKELSKDIDAAAKKQAVKPAAAAAPESEDARKKIEALELSTRKLGATTAELSAIELAEFKQLTENKKQVIDFTAALEARRKKEEEIYGEKIKSAAQTAISKTGELTPKKYDNTVLTPEEMSNETERINDYYDAKINMLVQSGETQAAIEKAYHDKSVEMERLTWQQRHAIASTMSTSLVGLTTDLQTLLGKKNRTLFEAGKVFAIADATIKGYQIIMGAWNNGKDIHYVVGIAMAAAAAVKVAAQIQQIRDTKYDSGGQTPTFVGGGVPSSGGGGGGSFEGTTARDTQIPQAAQQITVNIYNPLNGEIAADVADAIVAAINGAAERNVNVTVKAA